MLEVDGHEFDRADRRWKLVEMLAFHRLRRRMVDLEDANARELAHTPRATIEPSAKDDELLRSASDGVAHRGVDDLCAHRHQVGGPTREGEPDALAFGADLRLDARESARPPLVEKDARGGVVEVAYVRGTGIGQSAHVGDHHGGRARASFSAQHP